MVILLADPRFRLGSDILHVILNAYGYERADIVDLLLPHVRRYLDANDDVSAHVLLETAQELVAQEEGTVGASLLSQSTRDWKEKYWHIVNHEDFPKYNEHDEFVSPIDRLPLISPVQLGDMFVNRLSVQCKDGDLINPFNRQKIEPPLLVDKDRQEATFNFLMSQCENKEQCKQRVQELRIAVDEQYAV